MENYKVWLERQACHVEMLEWWEELVAIRNVEDHRKLTQKICASFEIPRVRCKALEVTNDFSAPPALKCIQRKLFLLALDPRLPCQDYHQEQPQKTLAYTQALQYWAERANPPGPGEMCFLVRCVQELRPAMKPFTTFSDFAILEKAMPDHGTPEAEVEGAAQPGTTLTMQTPMPDTRPSTPPAVPANEPTIPTAPPVTTNNKEGTAGHQYPNWTKIHPSHPVASVGHIPLSLGDLRQCCHSCSSSRRRAQCCQIEEQLSSDQGDSSLIPGLP